MKPRLVLVCGPWSSGTTAVTGALIHAGLAGFGPYFMTIDPRTPNSYELIPFRDAILSVASEQTLGLTERAPERIFDVFGRFRDDLLAQRLGKYDPESDPPLVMKYALSALVLPALDRFFDLRLVLVTRPPAAIEATRLRRGWIPQLGSAGAHVIYSQLFSALLEHGYPCQIVHFPGFLREPESSLDAMLAFSGHTASPEQRSAALGFIRKSP